MTLLPYPRLFISAYKKSSGKTLLTLGLASALTKEGKRIRLYKKGPDYIDPMWHKAATGHESYNLDSFLMPPETCRNIFLEHSNRFDLSIIEGNHGLHDGLDLEGKYSSAALAKQLDTPVILVLDSTGMNRNIAAILLGLQNFDPDVNIQGVILNKVKSGRQEQKQIQAIEKYCGIPVLGSIPVIKNNLIRERHLGLISIREEKKSRAIIMAARELVLKNIDLDQVQQIAHQAPWLELAASQTPWLKPETARNNTSSTVSIGVANDPAFCFYYPDNLKALETAGAKLVYFNSLKASALPKVDGLYIAGGFPESFLGELENNFSLREDIRQKIEGGMPTYAECGGMMYLTRSIRKDGHVNRMVGVIKADVQFQKKPVGHGYVELSSINELSWLKLKGDIRGHEFHYSKLKNIDPETQFNFKLKRGTGIGNCRDGIVYKNLLASYTHIHEKSVPEWSQCFTDFIRDQKAASPN